ncbi:MAG: FHA domain-containing protein [Deltaproteobacteria bacterium]|nr:FHA domain-containing protein [Deltaproteobacteria bacterium]
MGFTLTISEGKDRGREYTFDQAEVCIGRTAENDLVLTEAGVSRRHVKIREDGGQFFVEDLGSANGTKVNGNPVTEDELRDGDSVQVGPVIFAFQGLAAAGGDSTRIFDPAEVAKKAAATKKAQASAAQGAGAQKRAVTSVAPAVARAPASAARTSSPKNPGPANGASSKALAKRGPSAPAAPPKSASERARERRAANTPLAKFQLFWANASKGVRAGVVGGMGVVVLGLIFVIVRAATGGGGPSVLAGDESKNVFDIGPEANANDAWGVGVDGISHITADKAQFQFTFPVTAKKATATIHFTTSGIPKPEQVDVAANTVHIGFVQPSFGDQQKEQEIPIPTKYLKPNEKNKVVFDHLKNPPGQEPWFLTKVWVEVQQLPEDTPQNLMRRAREQIVVGDRAWEFRQVGADNTYRAWKAYQEAKLYLEALDQKVDELDVVRQKIKDAKNELDAICSKQMLKGVSAEQQGHADVAIQIYKGALSFFPEKDHPCFQQLHEKLNSLE